MNTNFFNVFRTETAEWDTKTWQTLLLSAIGAGISIYKYYPELVDEFQKKFVNWINADKKDVNTNNFILYLLLLGAALIYLNNLSNPIDTTVVPVLPKADEEETLPKMPEIALPTEQPKSTPVIPT